MSEFFSAFLKVTGQSISLFGSETAKIWLSFLMFTMSVLLSCLDFG
jgi:hypothetical protein